MNLQVNGAHSGVLSTWRRAGTLAWFSPEELEKVELQMNMKVQVKSLTGEQLVNDQVIKEQNRVTSCLYTLALLKED